MRNPATISKNLAEARKAIRSGSREDRVLAEVARLAYGNPVDSQQINRVKRAADGSVDTAYDLFRRAMPGHVVRIAMGENMTCTAEIKPVIPFGVEESIVEGSGTTGGAAVIDAMLTAADAREKD